ncbi:homocysteine S-methyltransferase family protein [Streptomyces scabiei]|uniref:hypothetical protein n=1 Tax=Streptomyces scabiei TaxID=1930 RepID=UPI000B1AC9C4|nr:MULTISPECIES: hypothetical protein [Streptomyces]QTU45625.1 homocysteine S-methyltransferase family protein [Streptomyces sp. LBUM 1482]
MGHATDQTPAQPTPEPPRENPIFRQPATVQACQQDYEAGADVRRRLDQQIAKRA